MEQPIYYWDPSIAPSGVAFYTGDVPGMARQSVRRRAGGPGAAPPGARRRKIVGEERLLPNLGERIRDVRQGPDGFIYLLTDSAQGRVSGCGPPINDPER